ncbi:hypothetical protein DFJ74DRAFT_671238 [Hyaloraphidium curvatum]|nr:hypothetical protein DFJ74DRAFT_671238 [Hyaloraphidium curvatum]
MRPASPHPRLLAAALMAALLAAAPSSALNARQGARPIGDPCTASGPLQCASGCCVDGLCAATATCFPGGEIGAACTASGTQCQSLCCFQARCAAPAACFPDVTAIPTGTRTATSSTAVPATSITSASVLPTVPVCGWGTFFNGTTCVVCTSPADGTNCADVPGPPVSWFDSLSSGAKAGFIIGVVVGGLLLLGLLGWLLYSCGKKRAEEGKVAAKQVAVEEGDVKVAAAAPPGSPSAPGDKAPSVMEMAPKIDAPAWEGVIAPPTRRLDADPSPCQRPADVHASSIAARTPEPDSDFAVTAHRAVPAAGIAVAAAGASAMAVAGERAAGDRTSVAFQVPDTVGAGTATAADATKAANRLSMPPPSAPPVPRSTRPRPATVVIDGDAVFGSVGTRNRYSYAGTAPASRRSGVWDPSAFVPAQQPIFIGPNGGYYVPSEDGMVPLTPPPGFYPAPLMVMQPSRNSFVDGGPAAAQASAGASVGASNRDSVVSTGADSGFAATPGRPSAMKKQGATTKANRMSVQLPAEPAEAEDAVQEHPALPTVPSENGSSA